MHRMFSRMTITVPRRFSLAHAVCSYGFFVLAPSRWEKGKLHRPLRLGGGEVVHAQVGQRAIGQPLHVKLSAKVRRGERAIIESQVRRMLRLDESFTQWRRLHPVAARARFDCLFRSPSLFEDIVKTFTSCNVTWAMTIRMNQLLCEHAGRDGDFPTPPELAAWSAEDLSRVCRVGYRAERIVRLARDVVEGRLDLAWFEDPVRGTDEVYDGLRRIHGVGPYAAANILQLLGRYDRLAVDSELIRHFAQVHNVTGDMKQVTAAAVAYYQAYHPYQFLAYWFEQWGSYESRFGAARQWNEAKAASLTQRG